MTGATGTVGSNVVRELQARGVPVRGHARDADRAVAALGAQVGSPLAFWDIQGRIEQHLDQAGLPVVVLQPSFSLFGFLREGAHDATTTELHDLTGQEPRRFDDFARDHAAPFAR